MLRSRMAMRQVGANKLVAGLRFVFSLMMEEYVVADQDLNIPGIENMDARGRKIIYRFLGAI